MKLWDRLREGLARTRQNLTDKIDGLVSRHTAIDEDLFDELEEVLIEADMGPETSMALVDEVRQRVRRDKVKEPVRVREILKEEIRRFMGDEPPSLRVNGFCPAVILVVGVNGAGKTTTIGKVAHRYKKEGRRVLIAAADTFRAAAAEQLEVWAGRAGVELVRHGEGADPAAVAYDAMKAAQSRQTDLLLIDTAGRLQTKTNLMEELKKINRVVGRECPGAPHEVLLVLDATTGQNGVSQAKLFKEAVAVTGVVLTKLDSTAKGGVVVSISRDLGLPVKLVGVGEGMEDLQPFEVQAYVDGLLGG
ncbi:MAG TPA: signal recognition particle-docking protein FtsY [Spirochaetia bacterium]|nr:signal recognition particle-docking protein FtsY [Spirochaetia bacterium]